MKKLLSCVGLSISSLAFGWGGNYTDLQAIKDVGEMLPSQIDYRPSGVCTYIIPAPPFIMVMPQESYYYPDLFVTVYRDIGYDPLTSANVIDKTLFAGMGGISRAVMNVGLGRDGHNTSHFGGSSKSKGIDQNYYYTDVMASSIYPALLNPVRYDTIHTLLCFIS